MCLTASLHIFDTNRGFTIKNETTQNVYVEKPDNTFDKVLAGVTAGPYKVQGSYIVRNDSTETADIYMTIAVDASLNFSVTGAGKISGKFVVTANFK
jgi:hypothetical protein